MTRRPFFKQPAGLTVHEIALLTGAQPRPGAKLDHVVTDIAALEHAGPSDLVFVEAPRYAEALASTQAGVCLTRERLESPRAGWRDRAARRRALSRLRHRGARAVSGIAAARLAVRGQGRGAERIGACLGPARERRHRRPRRDDRAARCDRARQRHRRRRGDRSGRQDRPPLLDRARRVGRPRPDRRPRDHPCRLPHRRGRLRLQLGAAGSRQGAAGRPRHHPGRRGDRGGHDGRSRRHPRHRDRRGQQDRQPGPDRPQRDRGPPLHHRGAIRLERQRDARRLRRSRRPRRHHRARHDRRGCAARRAVHGAARRAARSALGRFAQRQADQAVSSAKWWQSSAARADPTGSRSPNEARQRNPGPRRKR